MMMKYDDGAEVVVGDRVLIDSDMTGRVATDIDAQVGDDAWFYLKAGLMVETDQVGLVHYAQRPDSLVRQTNGRA